MREILIIPVNGYLNRLQAVASTYSLSLELGACFKVLWLKDSIASTDLSSLFAEEFIQKYFVDLCYVSTKYSINDILDIPLYLNIDEERKVITLVGHDKGEQFFMNQLNLLVNNIEYKDFSIIIKAGGKFSLSNAPDFIENRRFFYNNILFASDIYNFVNQKKFKLPYLGLHLRTTDRSIHSPTRRQLINYLLKLQQELGINHVFLASDNSNYDAKFTKNLNALGFDVFKANTDILDRIHPEAGRQAMIDWLILSRSVATAYHKDSSFSQEAAILNINSEKSRGFLAPWYWQLLRYIYLLVNSIKKRLSK
jgi:hypothetical protein